MNDSDRNNPKPLPDDFGMTIPNLRLPNKQNQGSESDLPTTNLRSTPHPLKNSSNATTQSAPPPIPVDDFGMTMPNLRPPAKSQQQPPPQQSYFPQISQQPQAPVNDFDLTAPNIRVPKQEAPTEPDFGITLNNFQPQSSAEPDYGATMSYIPAVTQQRSTRGAEVSEAAVAAPPVLPHLKQSAKPIKKGVPWWVWLLGAGFAFFSLLIVLGIAAYLLIPRDSGFTLVLKRAPAGSKVLVDGTLRGVTAADGSIKILGIEAEKKRIIKVSKENCSDFNDTIIGQKGETKELIAQMKCGLTPAPEPPKNNCADDPRVCAGEKAALDALDKLVPPFTVDQWADAMNKQIINFDTNSADVPPARKTVLEKGAEKFKLLTGNPGIEVGGHTDNVGNDASNQKLSESRAQAVRFILVNNGVNAKAFTTRGYGSKKPVGGNLKSNDTDDGRFQNRRIEYTVTSK